MKNANYILSCVTRDAAGGPSCAACVASCACPNASISVPSILERRGEHPAWDEYLEAVYGPRVAYPASLVRLQWFYRCNCLTLDGACRTSHAACSVASDMRAWESKQSTRLLVRPWAEQTSWRTSCGSRKRAPLGGILPKVWLTSLPQIERGQAVGTEAFVGARSTKYASPEFWLAPFGLWRFPLAHPRCLPADTWVEVLRVAQPTEGSDSRSTFYFHAPGSGIWLWLGATACCRNKINFDRHFLDLVYGPSYSPLPATFGFERLSTDRVCRSFGMRYANHASAFATLQRPGNSGNLMEIIDLRDGSGATGSACGASRWLRYGWNASAECRCDERQLILNCDRAAT